MLLLSDCALVIHSADQSVIYDWLISQIRLFTFRYWAFFLSTSPSLEQIM